MGEPGRILVEPAVSGDSLLPLQDAVNSLQGAGGEIVLVSTRPYLLSGTLYLPKPTDGGKVINIKSIGTAVLRPLDMARPPVEGLIRVESNWGYKVEGLFLEGPGQRDDKVPRAGVGFWLGREAGHGSCGTSGGSAILEHIQVSGFGIGFKLGTTDGTATSELLFNHCAAKVCDIGMELLDYNTLDISLNMWGIEACKVGIQTAQAGDVHIMGGSASNNDLDFRLTTGGTFSINNFRSEGARQFFWSGSTTAKTNIVINSCEVKAIRDPINTPAVHGGWGNTLTIVSSSFSGWIGWQQVFGVGILPSVGTLTMIGTNVIGTQPFRGDSNATAVPYRIFGCSYRLPGKTDEVPDGWFPDQVGVVRGTELIPAWQMDGNGLFKLGNQPVVTGSWVDGSAGRNLAAALEQAGLIVNRTT